ncbi:MAG: MATE family efflux transporter [Lachnospiraceae bacterium]|nr:MATE family efflux transporter [Lachnospiraceae bacterium]
MESREINLNFKSEFIVIAVPAILENLVGVFITAIDTRMIAPLGKTAVSAVSLTVQPKLLFLSVFYALGTAASIYVSQALGRKDRKEANKYFHSVLSICILLSVILGAGLALLAGPVMRLFSRQQETLAMSISFFRIIMGLMIFQTVSIVLNAALRGIGETRVTFVSSIFMGVVDILVNYMLIEGHWGFPALGVDGDAIGTVAGTVAACAVSVYFLLRHSDFLTLRGIIKNIDRQSEVMLQIRSKTGNLIFENLFTRIGFLISSLIISGLSAEATAVYFVAMILLNYTFSFGDGLHSAIVSLTGRSMGAGSEKDVRKFLRQGRMVGLVVSIVLSIIYILGAKWFFGLYFTDSISVNKGLQYSYVAAVLTVLQILRLVNIAAMKGVGEVKIPRVLATACVMLINPLTGYLLTYVLGYGVWGIWFSSLITQIVWCLMSFIKINSCIETHLRAQTPDKT